MSKRTSKKKTISDRTVWDSKIRQLGLRNRNGQETWIVKTTDPLGKARRRTLGLVSEIVIEDARQQARSMLSDGVDDDRLIERLTICELDARFMAARKPEWAAVTYSGRKSLTKRVMHPHIGDVLVHELKAPDVVRWLDGLEIANGSRNIALAHLSGMMRHAEILGLRSPGSNPCKGMRKRKTGFKAKYLTRAEFRRLGTALRKAEPQHETVVVFLRFLAFTGARFNEARDLTWEQIETDRVYLPNSKTGPRTLWLGEPVRDMLSGLSRNGRYVFQNGGQKLAELAIRTVWHQIRKRAGLPTLRIHDLRHNFASVGIGQGESLRSIAGLLGHARLDATQGYAHLAEGPLKTSAQIVARDMSKKLGMGPRRKPKATPVSPFDAPEFDLVKEFLKNGHLLPPFCEAHGLELKPFHKRIMKFRKLQARMSA